MELGGDEKRIQALFSELSFADQSRVPQFGHLWTRAQVSKESRGIGRPVAVLVSLLVTAAACSFAVWTWYRSAETPNILVQLPPAIEATYTPTPVKVEPARRDIRSTLHVDDKSIAASPLKLHCFRVGNRPRNVLWRRQQISRWARCRP